MKTKAGVRVLREGASHITKFNSSGRHVDLDGKPVWCASDAEAQRLEQLIELRAGGYIDQLQAQVKFLLVINGVSCGSYRADFQYQVIEENRIIRTVVEDVKGVITEVFLLKRKLVEAIHRVHIDEIPAKEIAHWRMQIPVPNHRRG